MKERLHFYVILFALAALVAGCGKSGQEPAPKPAATALPKEPEKPVHKRPEAVRGVYLTAWSAGSTRKMAKVYELVASTDINSLVIDIRDAGHMYIKNDIELAKAAGANTIAIRDLKKLVAEVVAKDIYPIARIACFRDIYVPKAVKQRAVVRPDGSVWKDGGGYTWLDPYNQKNWDYLAQTIDLALDAGFPEIQLDYVRFPSEGKKDQMRFPAKSAYPDQTAKPADVIAAFAKKMADRVREKGAIISADIFGIISSGKSDQGIGQELEQISEPFDVVSPMVYPSHYAKGEYGIANPNASPYAILKKSLADYQKRLKSKDVRPWLQDFSLFGVTYGHDQVRAQIKACFEAGYFGFLLWNPKNNYTASAVKNLAELENKVRDQAAASKPAPQPGSSPPPADPQKAGG